MPDINDIHRFFEANLPGYQRKDNLAVMRFFLSQSGHSYKKPIKTFLKNFLRMKEFVCYDWQGEEVRNTPLQNKPTTYGNPKSKSEKCKCGGKMVVRENRKDGSLFYGCSKWPKCTITKAYE